MGLKAFMASQRQRAGAKAHPFDDYTIVEVPESRNKLRRTPRAKDFEHYVTVVAGDPAAPERRGTFVVPERVLYMSTFMKMLLSAETSFAEQNAKCIDLPTVEPHVFEQVLRFMTLYYWESVACMIPVEGPIKAPPLLLPPQPAVAAATTSSQTEGDNAPTDASDDVLGLDESDSEDDDASGGVLAHLRAADPSAAAAPVDVAIAEGEARRGASAAGPQQPVVPIWFPITPAEVFDLLQAAHFLDIQPLVSLTSQMVADYFHEVPDVTGMGHALLSGIFRRLKPEALARAERRKDVQAIGVDSSELWREHLQIFRLRLPWPVLRTIDAAADAVSPPAAPAASEWPAGPPDANFTRTFTPDATIPRHVQLRRLWLAAYIQRLSDRSTSKVGHALRFAEAVREFGAEVSYQHRVEGLTLGALEGVMSLGEYLGAIPNVECLALDVKMTADTAKELGAALPGFQKLERLELAGCEITDAQVVPLARGLRERAKRGGPPLGLLALPNNRLTNRGIARVLLAAGAGGVVELDLSSNMMIGVELPVRKAQWAAWLRETRTNAEKVESELGEKAEEPSGSKAASMDGSGSTPSSAAAAPAAAAGESVLRHLSLSGNNIGMRIGESLAWWNRSGSDRRGGFARLVFNRPGSVRRRPYTSEADADAHFQSEAASVVDTWTRIRSPAGIKAFNQQRKKLAAGHTFVRLPELLPASLEAIDLSGCELSLCERDVPELMSYDRHLLPEELLSDALPKLRALDLYGNRLNDCGLDSLFKALERDPALEEINLTQSSVTDQVLLDHSEPLAASNTHLRTLNLMQTHLGRPGAQALADALARHAGSHRVTSLTIPTRANISPECRALFATAGVALQET